MSALSIILLWPLRKVHCESSKKWLGILRAKKVPVLVCLTHADKLYSEYMTKDGHHPDEAFIKKQLPQQLRVSHYILATGSTVEPLYIADTIGELHVGRYRGPAIAEGFYKYYNMKSGPELWPLYIVYGRYSGVAVKRGSTVLVRYTIVMIRNYSTGLSAYLHGARLCIVYMIFEEWDE